MPNVIEQRITAAEVFIRASNGREVTITRAEIDGLLKAQAGDDQTRATAVADTLAITIADFLGRTDKNDRIIHDMLSPDEIGLVIDPSRACVTALLTGKDAQLTAASAASALAGKPT